MSANSKIEWTEATWNPIVGCSIVSPGCTNCYAMRMAARLQKMNRTGGSGTGYVNHYDGTTQPSKAGPVWTGRVTLAPDKLFRKPLHVRKPTTFFVNSMGDLFHEDVPDEWIDRVFAVMALSPQHTFQCLTKRAERMRKYCSDQQAPFRVARQIDRIDVAQAVAATAEETRPIDAFPGYYISNTGKVFSSNGSSVCLHCGGPVDGIATKRYCTKKCKQNADFHRRKGRPDRFAPALTEMSLDVGEQGHSRAWLYRDGEQHRELVHRLVLTTFVRPPEDGEQGCHRDGNATNNHVANLRWGTQEHNWDDRRRHGNARAHGERCGVLAPIEWPLPNCWKGISAERQQEFNERWPHLRDTPAAIRFISYEPALGRLDACEALGIWQRQSQQPDGTFTCTWERADITGPRPDWFICGGESGPNARPMHPAWARSLRDQCAAAGVPFFFKQWGEWAPRWPGDRSDGMELERVGKKRAGRLLDGREWSQMPEVASA